MSFKPIDDRQIVNRAILQQLFPWVGSKTLDVLMSSVNADLTAPLKVDATSTPSLVVNIGPAIVSNPESSRNRTISFINNLLPVFTSGTVTFPSTSGGTIVVSPGSNVTLTCPSNQYVQVLLALDAVGAINIKVGTPNAVLANAVVPAPVTNTLPFAYVTIHNISGTIQNVTQSTIYQFEGGAGSGGSGGTAGTQALTTGTITQLVTFPVAQISSNYVVLAQIVNQTDVNPEYIPVTITNKTTAGFTASWNAPLPSTNYLLDYIVPPATIQEMSGEIILAQGDTFATISITTPVPGVNYSVIAELVDLTDINPQFQPVTVTQKTTTTFTVQWNMPLPTANYRLGYQIAAYQ